MDLQNALRDRACFVLCRRELVSGIPLRTAVLAADPLPNVFLSLARQTPEVSAVEAVSESTMLNHTDHPDHDL